jgi:hypothetical protein
MFYFFQRQSQYVRCELRPVSGTEACELAVTNGDQPERVERYPSWEAAQARWHELKESFADEGWAGPLGRE